MTFKISELSFDQILKKQIMSDEELYLLLNEQKFSIMAKSKGGTQILQNYKYLATWSKILKTIMKSLEDLTTIVKKKNHHLMMRHWS